MAKGGSRDIRDALADIDITKPNIARVYDYFVGGKDNFSADREFARRAMEMAPKAPLAAKNNRAFLRRVVQYLVGEAGITQIILDATCKAGGGEGCVYLVGGGVVAPGLLRQGLVVELQGGWLRIHSSYDFIGTNGG